MKKYNTNQFLVFLINELKDFSPDPENNLEEAIRQYGVAQLIVETKNFAKELPQLSKRDKEELDTMVSLSKALMSKFVNASAAKRKKHD